MHSRPERLGQVIDAVHRQRAGWDLDRLGEQITGRAHQLNASHPLIGDEDFRTTPGSGQLPRFGVFFDWIIPDTIISGPLGPGTTSLLTGPTSSPPSSGPC
ncbi:hypothetical protein [Actinocatenispora comari]|uniref:Uncharacterized protein n=1 Tax=Actinocatenispora comari TaxID=2807577 RepID=A0A8J4EMU4_9ACTN|nr:hypothetical protein [Actinocatenispora comari]GIL29138.1 hypothetical protein NUM_43920 [Actinocatenispora comari]